jgi:hypothetical protein
MENIGDILVISGLSTRALGLLTVEDGLRLIKAAASISEPEALQSLITLAEQLASQHSNDVAAASSDCAQ